MVSQKQKICILHHTGMFGGGTKSFIDISKMLKDNFEVIACIPEDSKKLAEILVKDGIRVQYIKTKFPTFPIYSGGSNIFSRTMFKEILNWLNIDRFCKEINSINPDIVIFNSIITVISAIKLNRSIKKICFIRETVINNFAKKFFSNILNKYFAATCFLAEAEKDKLKLNKPKTVVIPDCMPHDDIKLEKVETAKKKLEIKNDDFCILYMGGDNLIKGPFVILEAMKQLKKGYKLIFIGGMSESVLSMKSILKTLFSVKHTLRKIRLKRAYDNIKNENNVIYIGYKHDISDYMNAADVVVFPSVCVHQPRPCIEAGYYKKPVIISDYEETKEYFIDGYNALTFKPGNSKELANKIRLLSCDKELREHIGINNYNESIEKHNFESVNRKLEEFLTESVIL